MFKLKKILGARYNAPEIVEIAIEVNSECHPGYFYVFNGQKLLDHDGTECKNVFTPIESVIGNGEVKKVKGYYVTKDMIFEGKLFGNVALLGVGDAVEAHFNDANLVDGVLVTEGTFAYIESIDDYENTGNVTFRLQL